METLETGMAIRTAKKLRKYSDIEPGNFDIVRHKNSMQEGAVIQTAEGNTRALVNFGNSRDWYPTEDLFFISGRSK